MTSRWGSRHRPTPFPTSSPSDPHPRRPAGVQGQPDRRTGRAGDGGGRAARMARGRGAPAPARRRGSGDGRCAGGCAARPVAHRLGARRAGAPAPGAVGELGRRRGGGDGARLGPVAARLRRSATRWSPAPWAPASSSATRWSRAVTTLLVGVGGSATNDGGAGALQALGYRFLDTSGASAAAGRRSASQSRPHRAGRPVRPSSPGSR